MDQGWYLFTCPDGPYQDGPDEPIIGCGRQFMALINEESDDMVDCEHCGVAFVPEQGNPLWVHGEDET